MIFILVWILLNLDFLKLHIILAFLFIACRNCSLLLKQIVYHLHIKNSFSVVHPCSVRPFYWSAILRVKYLSNHFAKMFMNCNFLVEFVGSHMHTVVSSENSDTLTSSFPVYILSISFSCLIAVATTWSCILKSWLPCTWF